MVAKTDLLDYLSPYKNQTVDFLTNHGNIGDTLIFKGTLALCKQLNIKLNLVNKITTNHNSVIFVSGGGNLIDHYSVLPTWLLPRVQQASLIYDKVVILPHTIYGEKLLEGIMPYMNNIDIICRERYSYEFLSKSIDEKHLLLSDDMAFYLDYSSIQKKGKGKLNVIRTDGEKTNIPIPEGNIDLSEEFSIGKPYQHNYWELDYWEDFPDQLVQYMNEFEEIVTNRLHIGIAGALLNKKTTIYPNSYFKNQGIYELSLQDMDHVSFENKS